MSVRKLRLGQLEIGPVNAKYFLSMVAAHGHSEATGGPVGAQYEAELAAGQPDVGTLGLTACGRVVGALSFAALPLPRKTGAVAGRLDVVVTEPHCRGKGIGTLLMASLFEGFIDKYRDRLQHFSVIAQHPSVARFVEKLGFQKANISKAPLYQISLDNQPNLECLKTQADLAVSHNLRELRWQCIACQSKQWVSPWCEPQSDKKKPR